MADESGRPDKALIRKFRQRTTLLTAFAVTLAFVFYVPGFSRRLLHDAPVALRTKADAFFPALLLWLTAGALTFAVLRSGEAIRSAPQATRRVAARWCVALGLVIGTALYMCSGWGLPLFERRVVGDLSLNQMLVAPPFVLTNPELLQVQRSLASAGGYSIRVAQTLELRAWMAVAAPVMSLAIAAAMLTPWPARRVLRTLLAHALGFALFNFALGLTVGPTAFLSPGRFLFDLGWALLVLIAVLSWRVLRREWHADPIGLRAPGIRNSP